MDRHRGIGGGGSGDRYSGEPPDSRQYRNTRAPPRPILNDSYAINTRQNRSSPPANYYNQGFFGGGRDRASLDSPPRFPTSGGGNGRGAGFRPNGSGGGGAVNLDYQVPITGQKRGFPFSGPAGSPDTLDGGAFAKLFVGSVPRTATEDDIRPLFDEHGHVLEVALIKDKRTGQQQGCCFIKYATSVEADRAIRALHNQHTLPGGVGPIQVRYADGERERLGAVEYKLFVGSLNKQAIEKEVEEIFSPYGRVEDVYLMRDEKKQSRGCGFVKYAGREMAMAAINALNGIYIMRGCDQPLTVRFADPKRPRPGESRGAPAFGGPGPRFQSPGVRPMPNMVENMQNQNLSNAWQPTIPQNQGASSDGGINSLSSRFPAPSAPGGSLAGGFSGSADGSLPGVPVSSSSPLPRNYNQSMPQVPSLSQQISPLQQQQHQHQHQQFAAGSYSQKQTSGAQPSQLQAQIPATQPPFVQSFPTQKLHGVNGQLPFSQSQNKQSLSPAAAQTPSNVNVAPRAFSGMTNQQQLTPQQQIHQPTPQAPSQLTAQMLSQQTQALQARLQSSQQAFSQIQQQLQMLQPTNQNFAVQQGSEDSSQQTSWAGNTPQTSVSTKVIPPVSDGPSVAPAASVISEMTHGVVPLKCNWTEHTSPEGFKYYYNSATGESKWEKPEELSSFEKQQSQQLQKSSVQQSQIQSQPQGLRAQQIPPNAQSQFQSQPHAQLPHPQHLQQASQSPYQAPGFAGQGIQDLAYKQSPAVTSSVNDPAGPARYQQGFQGAQEWMWKNGPTGA